MSENLLDDGSMNVDRITDAHQQDAVVASPIPDPFLNGYARDFSCALNELQLCDATDLRRIGATLCELSREMYLRLYAVATVESDRAKEVQGLFHEAVMFMDRRRTEADLHVFRENIAERCESLEGVLAD
jgi:hypothetical protein